MNFPHHPRWATDMKQMSPGRERFLMPSGFSHRCTQGRRPWTGSSATLMAIVTSALSGCAMAESDCEFDETSFPAIRAVEDRASAFGLVVQSRSLNVSDFREACGDDISVGGSAAFFSNLDETIRALSKSSVPGNCEPFDRWIVAFEELARPDSNPIDSEDTDTIRRPVVRGTILSISSSTDKAPQLQVFAIEECEAHLTESRPTVWLVI